MTRPEPAAPSTSPTATPPTIAPTSVGRSVLIYACAFAVVGATPFLLLPFLTTRLAPQEFGEVTSFLMLTVLCANIAGLSAHGFVSVRYFKTPADQFKGIVTTSLWAILAAHAVAVLVLVAAHPLLNRALELPLGYTALAAVVALFLNGNLIFLAIFQSSGRPLLYLRARVIQGFCELGVCVGLVLFVQADASARIFSYALGITASSVVGWVACRRQQFLGGAADRAHLRGLFSFGLPMLPHLVAGSSISYLDRLVVSSLLGLESLGIYMVAMQIGLAMMALIEPLNKALAPWLFEQLAKNDPAVRALLVKRTYLFFAALMLVGTVVAVAAHLLFDIAIGEEYAGARPLIPWMVGAFVMQGMYYAVVNYLFYAEKTGRLSVISFTTAVVGCGISWTLTSRYGLQGAGASFLINNTILFVLVWAMSARTVPMPWLPWRRA